MRLTYANVKAACAKVLNLNADNARVLDYVNRAMERLLYEGPWKDCLHKYVVCINSGCITWPRELETIEAAAYCSSPMTLRNGFYDFIEAGPGLLNSGTCGPYLTLRTLDQTYVAFDDVVGADKKLAIYADGTEEAGSTVLVRYYDSNANKVYTSYNGEVIEGERIVVPAAGAYAYSTYEVLPNGLYDVQKPVTNYPIRLYEYDTVAATYRALAYYEPDETLPEYRRSLIPGFVVRDTGDCLTTKITVIGKIRFIAAINDNSNLVIHHADAIRLGVQAIHREENNLEDESVKFWQLANRCLDRQLRHFQGSGAVVPLRMVGAETFGGGICNIV